MRRKFLTYGLSLLAAALIGTTVPVYAADPSTGLGIGKKPNILVIWGDDIGYWNISAYNQGMLDYQTPKINRIGREGAMFTDLMSRIFTLK